MKSCERIKLILYNTFNIFEAALNIIVIAKGNGI